MPQAVSPLLLLIQIGNAFRRAFLSANVASNVERNELYLFTVAGSAGQFRTGDRIAMDFVWSVANPQEARFCKCLGEEEILG
jgi:hypothetical protein